MAEYTIRLECAEWERAIDDLTAELERPRPLPLSAETAGRLDEMIKAACRPIYATHVNYCSADASDRWLLLQPSELLVQLTAALRAWDGHGDFVFEGHGDDGTKAGLSGVEEQAFIPDGSESR